MNEFIKKYWIHGLGLGLIFTGIIYFIDLAIANEWLPVELRIALSVVLGLTGLYLGHQYHQKGKRTVGQVLAGTGVSVLYATIAYLSFTDGVTWSNGALLISMVALNVGVSIISFRYDMRILFNISLMGGLVTPFFIEAVHQMDVALFIYILSLNVAALASAVYKGWKESMALSFGLTVGLFGLYYSLFEPEQWGRPFLYLSAFFLVYTVGLLLYSLREKASPSGLSLYLGVLNGVHFVFWSVFIFKAFSLPHVIPLLIVGLVFMLISLVIYLKSQRSFSIGMAAYGLLGLLVVAIAGNDMGSLFDLGGIHHAFSAALWTAIVAAVYMVARRLRSAPALTASLIGLVGVITYWYGVAWEVEWVEFWGIEYLPFFNIGGMVWVAIAALSFHMSVFLSGQGESIFSGTDAKTLSLMTALLGHIVVGGLLSIQILNLWEAYDLHFVSEDLSLSVCWFVYALILFLWGAKSRSVIFSILGGGVLVLSTLKVFLWDLTGDSTIQKVLFLLVLGSLTLLIAKVRARSLSVTTRPIEAAASGAEEDADANDSPSV